MKKVAFTVIAGLLLMSCISKKNEKLMESSLRETDTRIIEDSNSLKASTVYEGILPCADCSGIQTTLKIYHGDGTMESHKFELTRIYKGKGDGKIMKQTGNFNLERGLGDDPNGTIYVLNWDKPESQQLFYGYNAANPNKIYLLNNKREKIKSDLNYSLDAKK